MGTEPSGSLATGSVGTAAAASPGAREEGPLGVASKTEGIDAGVSAGADSGHFSASALRSVLSVGTGHGGIEDGIHDELLPT